MSIWSRIAEALSRLARGEGLGALFERRRRPPELSVAFTIAVIALGAKMAKADGQVTRDEVAAFREVFVIPPEEEKNAARVFNLARTDVAGFEDYARRIARMFKDRPEVLCDLMEGLFHIALADGEYHPHEDAFLSRVAEIFGIPRARFAALRARFVRGAEPDPYAVLEVSPDAPLEEVRAAWRRIARDCHPDRLMARGLPEEAIEIGQKRLAAANAAWEAIRAERGGERLPEAAG
jgi:DnaJ like chaperone protein